VLLPISDTHECKLGTLPVTGHFMLPTNKTQWEENMEY